MTRSVYIIGGSGAGKSTAMARLIEGAGLELGEFTSIWSTFFEDRKTPTLVTLRGHRFEEGVYLGLMRDEFPGADGLDNAAGPVLRDWLKNAPSLPEVILGEGLVFSSEASLLALNAATDLLVLYMVQPEDVIAERQSARSHKLSPEWVAQTATRAANLVPKLERAGVRVVTNDVDSALLHVVGV